MNIFYIKQLIIFFVILCVSFVNLNYVVAQTPQWNNLVPGLSTKKILLRDKSIFSPELLAIKVNFEMFNLKILLASDLGLKRADVKKMAKKNNAIFAINTNFFDAQGTPLGLIIRNGRIIYPLHKGGKTLSSLVTISADKMNIINKEEPILSSISEAFQAGPRLVSNNKPSTIYSENELSRRSAICISKNQEIIFFISAGVLGCSLTEVQEAMLSAEINCQDGINLDGGGSSQVYLDLKTLGIDTGEEELFIFGRDPVPAAIGVFRLNSH